MKNYIYTVQGGGPFSRFLQCAVMPLADIDFDNAYLILNSYDEHNVDGHTMQETVDYIKNHRIQMQGYGIDNPYEHIVGYVLDQKTDHTYTNQGFLPIGPFYSSEDRLEDSNRLDDYKATLRKFHIKNEITNKVNNFCKSLAVNEKTLGVHVRMTTMALHNNFRFATMEDYYKAVDKELATGDWENIYVSTDNIESLVFMEQRYGRIVRYYPNLLRYPCCEIKNKVQWSWEYDWFFYKRHWQESFMEAMTLGRCGGMVCRESNFSNAAIVFSNSLRRIARV